MRTVFGDISFFVALLNPKDVLHESAQRLRRVLHPFHVVTTQMVLTEMLNYYSARGDPLRRSATTFVEQLQNAATTTRAMVSIVPQTSGLFETAFTVYRDRAGKAWSLTDCASFLVMQGKDIHDALTHDHHFEQMGFRALLRAG